MQRGLLRVADPRFDFAFPIRIPDSARRRDDAVVGEDVAIKRIQRGIVDVGREYALFEIVEHDDARGAAQPTNSFLILSALELKSIVGETVDP